MFLETLAMGNPLFCEMKEACKMTFVKMFFLVELLESQHLFGIHHPSFTIKTWKNVVKSGIFEIPLR